MKVDPHPTVCNLCGGEVELVPSTRIYGVPYGSGKVYVCKQCGASVGTHKLRPDDALGILANEEMRKLRKECHELFDKLWKPGDRRSMRRPDAYAWFARKMKLDIDDCHFGHFDLETLREAKKILNEKIVSRSQAKAKSKSLTRRRRAVLSGETDEDLEYQYLIK